MLIFLVVAVVLITIFIKISLKKQSQNFNKMIDEVSANIAETKRLNYEEIVKLKDRYDNIANMMGGDGDDD